jgi:glycosyltransferase involved in cell wall biosynthesis
MEAMALGIPVVCYLREDLKELFESQNLLNKEDLPIVNAQWFNIEDKLRYLISNPEKLQTIGQKSRDYVEKYHSLEVLGKQLALVNNKVLQVA